VSVEATTFRSFLNWPTAASNSQLLHSGLKSRALHTQASCSPFRTGHNPASLLQCGQNLFAFSFFQNVLHVGARPALRVRGGPVGL